MANKMQVKGKIKKEKSKDSPAGPGAMPHTGGNNCRCPNCRDKQRRNC